MAHSYIQINQLQVTTQLIHQHQSLLTQVYIDQLVQVFPRVSTHQFTCLFFGKGENLHKAGGKLRYFFCLFLLLDGLGWQNVLFMSDSNAAVFYLDQWMLWIVLVPLFTALAQVVIADSTLVPDSFEIISMAAITLKPIMNLTATILCQLFELLLYLLYHLALSSLQGQLHLFFQFTCLSLKPLIVLLVSFYFSSFTTEMQSWVFRS